MGLLFHSQKHINTKGTRLHASDLRMHRSVASHPIPSQSPIPTLAIGNREASFAPQCRPAGNDQKPSGYAQSYMVAICSTLQTRTRVCVQKVGRIAEARSWRWVSLILTCSLIINFQLLSLNACWAGAAAGSGWRGVACVIACADWLFAVPCSSAGG